MSDRPDPRDHDEPDAPPTVSGGRLTEAAQRIESRGVGVRDAGDSPRDPRENRPTVGITLMLLAVFTVWNPALLPATIYLAIAVAVIGLTSEDSPGWMRVRMGVLVGGTVLLGWWRPWVLVVVAAIVFMIFMHELGHYLMAKRAGMKVTEFFIFFGPKVWSFRRGETEYGIKCIPAGAYVKIVGMTNLEEVEPAEEARTYRQKTFGQRVGVAVAGSTMHFLMALALIVIALVWVGQPNGSIDPRVQERDWRIGSVSEGTGAADAGLREGDRILSIDGRKIDSFADVRSVTGELVGKTVPVVYDRGGTRETAEVSLQPRYQWFVARVPADTPPAQAGLRPGDELVSIGDVDLTSVRDLQALLEDLEGDQVSVAYQRLGPDGETQHSTDLTVSNLILQGNQVLVGISAEPGPEQRLSFTEAITAAPRDFLAVTALSAQGLGRFFTPGGIGDFAGQVGSARSDRAEAVPTSTESSAQLGGSGSAVSENRLMSLLGLIRLGGDVGEVQPAALISLFALINIFIGIFNLVPLLPFDGGHVMIAVYEKIQELRLGRRRYFTDAARLLPITYVVVVALALLFFSTIYLDLANPIST